MSTLDVATATPPVTQRSDAAAAGATDHPRQSAWLATAAMAVIVFLQVPVLVVVLAAFSKTAYLTIPPKGLTLHWFQAVLQDPST
jgi:putative spermidine/putrescine transport system permease protein